MLSCPPPQSGGGRQHAGHKGCNGTGHLSRDVLWRNAYWLSVVTQLSGQSGFTWACPSPHPSCSMRPAPGAGGGVGPGFHRQTGAEPSARLLVQGFETQLCTKLGEARAGQGLGGAAPPSPSLSPRPRVPGKRAGCGRWLCGFPWCVSTEADAGDGRHSPTRDLSPPWALSLG